MALACLFDGDVDIAWMYDQGCGHTDLEAHKLWKRAGLGREGGRLRNEGQFSLDHHISNMEL